MLSFQFQFDDYEEAETALQAFAETCRQLKTTLKKSTKPAAAPGVFAGGTARVELPSDSRAQADADLKTFMDTEGAKEVPVAPKRGSKKASKSEAAVMAEAVNAPPAEAETEKRADDTAAKKTVTVAPPSTITIDYLRTQVGQLTSARSKGGVMKVAEILKEFGVQKLPQLKEEDYPVVSRKLSEAILGDHIPH